jgi:hypothetical protein
MASACAATADGGTITARRSALEAIVRQRRANVTGRVDDIRARG